MLPLGAPVCWAVRLAWGAASVGFEVLGSGLRV